MVAKVSKAPTIGVTPDADERAQREVRERAWAAIERIGERNANLDPDEVLRHVTEVVEEVRQERYDRTHGKVAGGR
jgi:hypothetical protein